MVLPVTGDSRDLVDDVGRPRPRRRKIGEHLAIVRLLEEIEQGVGDLGADILGADRLDHGLVAALRGTCCSSSPFRRPHLARGRASAASIIASEAGPAAVAAGEVARGDLADMADAEREEEAVERRRALRVDRRDQIVAPRSRPSARGRADRSLRQPEDVGRRLEQAVAEEALDMDDAEPLDVERVAADEMAQPLDPLRRADQPAGAADVDLAFLAHRLGAAFGAMVGEDVGRAVLVRASDSRAPGG